MVSKDCCVEGLSLLLLLQPQLLRTQPDAGEELVRPGSRQPGAGSLLPVPTVCGPPFFSPFSRLWYFYFAFQPVFLNIYFLPCLPSVFPADWPSGGPDGRISLEWETRQSYPLGYRPL